MTYLNQSLLTTDVDFGRRVSAASIEQSRVYLDDARPQFVALAGALLTGEAGPTWTFLQMVAASPGFADTAADGDSVDSSKIPDGDILAAVQAEFPTVAGLFFAEDGTPLAEL